MGFFVPLKNRMKILHLLIAIYFTAVGVNAQDKGAIQGKIIDLELNNEPVLHANVKLNNTDLSTQTNFNGNFKIDNIKSGFYMLTVSFAGYDTVEIPVEIIANNVTRVEQGLKAKTIDVSSFLMQSN